MTNEEKAEELRKTALPNPLFDGYGMWLCSTNVDEILIKMAEWKEQQMIDKACEWLEENVFDYEYIYYDVGGFVSPEFRIEEFINDFKKAMTEGGGR